MFLALHFLLPLSLLSRFLSLFLLHSLPVWNVLFGLTGARGGSPALFFCFIE